MTAPVLFKRKVVAFLNTQYGDIFDDIDESVWHHNLRWLDRSGLALPLAAKLQLPENWNAVPASIHGILRARLIDNGKRMEEMLRYFHQASSALAASSVRYCCVKGFSLIPDCFGSIAERHQVDLDFLIAPADAERARYAIETLGYRLAQAEASGEMRFTKPWKKHLGTNAYLYQMPEAPPIELHTRVWEPETEAVGFPALPGFLDDTELHQIAGISFPRLKPAQQFVYLLLHIFRHLLSSWCRLLSLYEVATLMSSQSGNDRLWSDVAQIIGHDQGIASACALVLGVVKLAFPMDLPQPLQRLHLSADSALWLENYAREWLFTDPPGTKLSLLVQRQFCADGDTWRQYVRRRLLPLRRSPSICEDAAPETARTLAYRVEQMQYSVSRVWYHLRSDCEYLAARHRWQHLLHTRES
jgi:hypothetical protein